jgi:hypothetical protein
MFTIEELSIIKMYSGFSPDRNRVVTALKDSLPLIEEQDIKDTVLTVIRKANAMTEKAFSEIDLSNTLETTGL